MQDYYIKIINSSNLGLGSLVKSIKKDPDFLNYVIHETSFLEKSVDLSFRLFHIRNNLKNQITCKYCGTPLTKIRISFCNKKCSAFYSNADLNLKAKKSKAISISHSKKTKKEKEAISKKRENTNLKRYGVTNNLHIPEVKEKIVKKWIENHGFDRPAKSPKIKEILSKKAKANSKESVKKAKATSLKKYGADNIMKTDLGKQRVAESNIKNMDFPAQCKTQNFAKTILLITT
jgi:endogenous inhibitor of DNA gyrase (YacG/DUF329 family)